MKYYIINIIIKISILNFKNFMSNLQYKKLNITNSKNIIVGTNNLHNPDIFDFVFCI